MTEKTDQERKDEALKRYEFARAGLVSQSLSTCQEDCGKTAQNIADEWSGYINLVQTKTALILLLREGVAKEIRDGEDTYYARGDYTLGQRLASGDV